MNLSLRNKVRLVIVAVILLWFLSHALFVGVGNFLECREFWTLLLAVVIGIVFANLIVRRATSRYRAAVAREDLQAAQREYETLRHFWRRRGSETIKTYGINILILEGRYRDAVVQLQALDMKRIGDERCSGGNESNCLVSGTPGRTRKSTRTRPICTDTIKE